jgi:hypothetical protein
MLVSFLSDNTNAAYVQDRYGDTVFCEIVYANPPYVKTRPDGILADNLLSLPRF